MEEEKEPTMKDLMRAITETRAEMVTKADLAVSEQRLRTEMKEHHAEAQASFVDVREKIEKYRTESQASFEELGEAVHTLSTNTDEQIGSVHSEIRSEVGSVRSEMATKADLQQAKHEIMDHNDRKVDRVDEKADKTVDVLQKNNVITPAQAAFVLNT